MAAFGYGATTIGTTAVNVVASDNARKGTIIYNNGTAICYVGMDSGVTTVNGLPLLPQSSLDASNRFAGWRGDIYIISGSASQDIRWWYWQ